MRNTMILISGIAAFALLTSDASAVAQSHEARSPTNFALRTDGKPPTRFAELLGLIGKSQEIKPGGYDLILPAPPTGKYNFTAKFYCDSLSPEQKEKSPLCASELNQKIAAAKFLIDQKFNEAKLKHDIVTFRQIEASYDWQIFASNVSLWLVVIIVVAGVAFSGFQLWHAAISGQPQAESQLEVSAKNFRLTSSVVGVVVLGLSLFFFYLFVKEIYTIKVPTLTIASERTR